jgi:hypothetical protein
MTTPCKIPRPAASCAIRFFGVSPERPNAIMCPAIALAPALVPASTAPRSCARWIASASRVPATTDESRSWFPPVRKIPVASVSARQLGPGLATLLGLIPVMRPIPNPANSSR